MLILTVLCLSFFGTRIEGKEKEFNQCTTDNANFLLSCPKDFIINVIKSSYCTEDDDECCKPDTSNKVITEMCNKEQICSTVVGNHLCRDTCPEGKKKLCIRYKCVPGEVKEKNCGINEKLAKTKTCLSEMCYEKNTTVDTECEYEFLGKGCVCEEGFVRDRRTGRCILQKYCLLSDDKNVEFSECDAHKQKKCPVARVKRSTGHHDKPNEIIECKKCKVTVNLPNTPKRKPSKHLSRSSHSGAHSSQILFVKPPKRRSSHSHSHKGKNNKKMCMKSRVKLSRSGNLSGEECNPGNVCKDNYVLDTESNHCVKKKDCPSL